MLTFGPAQGWQCPLCKTVYAPGIQACGCARRQTVDATYSVPKETVPVTAIDIPIKVVENPYLPPEAWLLDYPGAGPVAAGFSSLEARKKHQAELDLRRALLEISEESDAPEGYQPVGVFGSPQEE